MASATMAYQISFCAKSKEGRARTPVSLAMRMRSSHVARRRWHNSRFASWVPGPPGAFANAVAVDVGDGQLRSGVGAVLADDHAHALGPATLPVGRA